MQDLEPSERYQLEYDSLTKRNKWKGNKKLYFQWRRGIVDDHEAAAKLGVTHESILNDRRRWPDKFNFDDSQIKEIRKKHVKKVEKNNKIIKKAQKLVGDSKSDKDRNPMNYSLEEHINQIMLTIDAEDSENLVELAVKVHRYMFLHEFSGYDKLRQLALQAIDKIDFNESDTVHIAKTLNDMLDKKQTSVEEKIKAIITEYNTLLSSAASEVMTDQEQQIDKLASFVLENNMDRLDEVVDLVDRGG